MHPICAYFGRKRLFTSFAAACRESRSVEVAASAGVLAPSASSDAKIPKSSRAETSRGISVERENDLAERQLPSSQNTEYGGQEYKKECPMGDWRGFDNK